MDFLELLRVTILSIIQGITEWLPVSSTGHMLLIDEFLNFTFSDEFRSFFFVVIQLASVMAVILTFFKELNPFKVKRGISLDIDKVQLWIKIIVACIPAILVALFFDDYIEALFYNPTTIAVALIFYGLVFIVVEQLNQRKKSRINSTYQITLMTAFLIGIFQALAIIPGTSRSGATIIGGLVLGMNRKIAAEFTFFLAIPVMFGASLLRLITTDLTLFTTSEWTTLIIGCILAFLVSIVTIKFLLGFIKRHDFKPFAYYRIALGLIILGYFWVI